MSDKKEINPADWPYFDPSRLPMLVAQRDEFRRRNTNYRRALEDIRKSYEAGEFEKLEHLLFMNTALTHRLVQRPTALTHFPERTT